MTTLSLPRPRRIRPLAVLAASVALVAASQVANLLQTHAAAPAGAAGNAPAALAPIGPLDAPAAGLAQGPAQNAPGSLAQIDHSISIWTANLAANARDFLSASNLATLYEARARLSGDAGDYGRAEEAANRSLLIEPRQLDVQVLQARLALATHDFGRALSEAASLDRTAPNQPAILAIMGDAQLELGDVDGAEARYREIQNLAPGAAVQARLARVAFIRGDAAGAVSESEVAYAAAETEGQTGPSLSWYAYLAGFQNLAAGKPEAAASWFDKAIAAWPGSHLALAGRARADAALGNVDAAIAGYRAAIAISPQPDSLTLLGDLLAASGDTRGAAEQYATVHVIARLQGSAGLIYNRQLALFEVNHAENLAEALALAQHELENRKDVYGYDTYAWALLANGRAADANAAMAGALALGTRDATMLYHAGAIALAVGDEARARELLTEALGIPGALDPLAASHATAALASIR
jgi:tetratricopeptide (TPR) repeat protein